MTSIGEQSLAETGMPAVGAARAPLLVLSLICGAIVIACWPSIAWLVDEWSSGSDLFGHGLLLAAVAIFLLLRSARMMRNDTISSNWLGVPLVLFLSLLWLLGHVGNVVMVHTAAVPLMLLAAVFAVFGRSGVHQLGFAVLYIFFALPIWEHMRFLFQEVTVLAVQQMISLVGVSAVIEGKMIHIPVGTFRVSNGCSGVNYFVIATAIAALYGHLFYSSWRMRGILLLIAGVFALATNWVRVASLVVIGDISNMQSPFINDHAIFGWVLFGIALTLLYWIAGRLDGNAATVVDSTDSAAVENPDFRPWPVAIATVLAIAAGPLWAAVVFDEEAQMREATIELPVVRGQWVGPLHTRSDWQPVFNGASGERLARYDSESGPVWLYGNVYLSQVQDRELIHLHNDIAGALYSNPTGYRQVQIDASNSLEVHELVAPDGGSRWLIWYWYEVDGRNVAGALRAKLTQTVSTLQGRPEAGVMSVATECFQDCEHAGLRLQEFLQTLGDDLALQYSVVGRSTDQ